MLQPESNAAEKQRVENLRSYSILDTMPEEDYDNLTAIAASICDTPVSLISLIDENRQWFKSKHGLDTSETLREFAFCAHAINEPGKVFAVRDARTDERFKDNPLVTGEPYVIFYTGVPLVTFEGFALGTLCVIDHKPRKLTEKQISGLKALSKQVINLLELRKIRREHEEALGKLNQQNQDLERFAYVAAHDLKMPVVNIMNMGRLFFKIFGESLDERGREILDIITNSAINLSSLVDGLLDYSKCEKVLQEKKQVILMTDIKKEIAAMFYNNPEVNINVLTTVDQIKINKSALSQILSNLILNAVKYNNKAVTKIEIGIAENASQYEFYLKDNGPGILPEHHNRIFAIFEVMVPEDRFGARGNGIGLATVKKLVDQMGGNIEVRSEAGEGACFYFNLPV